MKFKKIRVNINKFKQIYNNIKFIINILRKFKKFSNCFANMKIILNILKM